MYMYFIQGEENTEHKARKKERKKEKKIYYITLYSLPHTSCCQKAYLGQDFPDKQILKTDKPSK